MKVLKVFLAFAVTIIITAIITFIYLKSTGKDQKLLIFTVSMLLQPKQAFDPSTMALAPDYTLPSNWLSLPQRIDEADFLPEGVKGGVNDGNAEADVFYIHGTGYLNNQTWTSPLIANSATVDNARFSLANEASIFNGCCNIYAPHFRETSMLTYMALSPEKRDIILDAVYHDVSRAFNHFIANFNNERPIIIASHSQGTHLAIRLLKDIDLNHKIAQRIVAAYLIGSGPVSLHPAYINTLNHFTICKKAKDIGCIVHWDTYGENGKEKLFSSPEQSICVNPLSWEDNQRKASAKLNQGAAPISGVYTMKLVGDDLSDNVIFEPPQAVMAEYSWAQCRGGFLYVADQTGTEYEKLGKLPDKSYHGLDFPLFHTNIRTNAILRVNQFKALDN